jgi:hypothetical protein
MSKTIRDIWDHEEWAIDAMRLLGVIGPEELSSEEDLAVAVNVIGDELIFENALAAHGPVSFPRIWSRERMRNRLAETPPGVH